MVISNKCPFTVAAYLNVVADILDALIESKSRVFNLRSVNSRLLISCIGGLSRSFASKCEDALSQRRPPISTSGRLGDFSEGPSSSLLSTASGRCWNLIGKAGYSAAQGRSQSGSLTSGKFAAEEAGSSVILSDNSRRKEQADIDEGLRLDGSLVAHNYLTRSNDSDIRTQLSAWTRALGLAGHDRSVSVPSPHIAAKRFG